MMKIIAVSILFFLAIPSHAQSSVVTEMCLAATSEDNNKELNKVSNAKDEEALKSMLRGGRVVILQKGTKVIVLGGVITYKARVVNGDHAGLIVYVAREFVKRV